MEQGWIMKSVWELFESLDEAVYVSDPESNELVYMNACLRNLLGYRTHKEYRGKKCYEVLQGYSEPCSFCTNRTLTPSSFVSWVHKNPIVNKRFLIKDTLIEEHGKRYRMEIAIDMDSELHATTHYYPKTEAILNQCLKQLFSTSNPETAVDMMLSYLGKTFHCSRSYVFEIDPSNLLSNTYEWCLEGVLPQKDLLQREPLELIDWWMDAFREHQVVVIEDLEEIRTLHPKTYAFLKPQEISSMAAGPICAEGRLLGFIGVDNPDPETIPILSSLLHIIGYFLVSLLHQRDLLLHLNHLSFHDSLTGVFNQNALLDHCARQTPLASAGAICCDISGLKQVNASMGRLAGDELILQCCQLISRTLDTDRIYRIGGGAFLALFPNCSQSDFQLNLDSLRSQITQGSHYMALGHAWSDTAPLDLNALIDSANQIMYQNKREYYERKGIHRGADCSVPSPAVPDSGRSLFYQFWSSTYHDVEALFQSISAQNTSSYFYFGDMQRDLFYISDNMKQEFGFQSNVVPHLPHVWAKHITSPKFRKLYWQDLRDIIQKKRTVHDLRYQVRTASGKKIWIRCYGFIQWNQDKSLPLFFSGRITHQDNEFVVDPITNFPRVSVAFPRLQELQGSGTVCRVIGFSFNHITEINNTRGRSYADRLLKMIADGITEQLSDKMSFYRLEGMRCIALVDPECQESGADLIQQLRTIIHHCYHTMDLSIHHACSFGILTFPSPSLTLDNFLEHIILLIRIAKHDGSKPYIDNSTTDIRKIRQVSGIALTLNQDVLNGMEHFRIVIQPVVCSRTGKIVGGEALLRWQYEGKDISPAVFIPMLEKGDTIHLVGRWVFEQAVRSCTRLISYIPDFYLTFNVSLRQLTDAHFIDIMKESLEKYHLDGSHLVAEMTESFLDEQPEKLASFVSACRELGLEIALDDFGSGYSSMQMLLRYPCRVIKLDRSLLDEMVDSDQKLQFIRSIVYACHQFGKKVCAEGVENQEQNAIIQDTGCDVIQGYYYYRPMELPALYQLLSEQTAPCDS